MTNDTYDLFRFYTLYLRTFPRSLKKKLTEGTAHKMNDKAFICQMMRSLNSIDSLKK